MDTSFAFVHEDFVEIHAIKNIKSGTIVAIIKGVLYASASLCLIAVDNIIMVRILLVIKKRF